MRHLASVILGPVLGFIAYVLFGFGAGRLSVEDGWSSDNVVGLLALVGAGVAYAILTIPRLSPIGPALVGLSYLGIGLWIISDLNSFTDVVPIDILGIDNSGFGPGLLSLALAIPLLATLLSPGRWVSVARPVGQPVPGAPPAQPGQFGSQPEPPPFGGQPNQFGGQPHQYGGQPNQYGGQPEFGGQPSYGGTPPIGAPYSGPPSFGPPPGSPVAPSGYDPYGTPPPSSGPPSSGPPDVTRRIQ